MLSDTYPSIDLLIGDGADHHHLIGPIPFVNVPYFRIFITFVEQEMCVSRTTPGTGRYHRLSLR